MSDTDTYEAGRALMAELIPAAPLDLYDRLGDEMRGWYVDEADRRSRAPEE